MTDFIIRIISAWGYGGVCVLMAIESAAVPLPSEIIAPFAGFLAAQGRFALVWVAFAGGIGSAAGSAVTYWIGFRFGRPLIEKYGKYVFVSHHDLHAADRFFARYGELSTFFGRLLPVVRTFISVPAGIERVHFWRFLLYSFVGSLVWTYALAYVGMKLGEHWDTLRDRFHNFDVAIAAVVFLGAVFWVWRHIRHMKKSKRA